MPSALEFKNMLLLHQPHPKPSFFPHSIRSNTELLLHHRKAQSLHFFSVPKTPTLTPSSKYIHHLILITNCTRQPNSSPPTNFTASKTTHETPEEKKSFYAAVSLIVGTAVGPGMLGLPSATTKSGPFPSTIAILLSWLYVISSIILVAELSFASMKEDGVSEVSFTSLATNAFGNRFGALVALIYACLSFSLMVACVSGIGSIISQWFPWMNHLLAHALFPFSIGTMIWACSFNIIDAANRFLCLIMLFSITALVIIGFSIARANIVSSFRYASWGLSSVMPAIPVTVLTLGFHVVTPFICKIAGDSVDDARKAILIGGSIPLIMVLSWNLIVLGLVGGKRVTDDPISLLLSVSSSALFAVQGFAFSALATSLIGYAVSFPKQIADTLDLILGRVDLKPEVGSYNNSSFRILVMMMVLGLPVLITSFFQSTFSRALDFAGVYANCFLFGILPPVMTYIYQAKNKLRSSILPWGDSALVLLLGIAVILGIWH